jgi:excinuclease ABC subunit C
LFRDENNLVLYVGQSRQIKRRVESYFRQKGLGPRTQKLVTQTARIETIPVTSPLEAVLLEAKLIHDYQPKYNSRGKDGKAYLAIRIEEKASVPTLSLVRKIKNDQAVYFGPFPKSWLIKTLLRNLRRVFPYCTCKGGYRRGCLYRQIGLCASPAPGDPPRSGRRYDEIIANLISFLEGDVAGHLSLLEKKLDRYRRQENYEAAAEMRDQIARLEYITQKVTPPGDYVQDLNLAEDIHEEELDELAKILNAQGGGISRLERIEAFDVSHFAGEAAVGSMVVFEKGRPCPDHYRRFKIRGREKRNDVKMIAEVISRRFKHANGKDRSFSQRPDLVLVDGGEGQLKAALGVIKSGHIAVAAVEKRWETLVLPAAGANKNKVVRINLKLGTPARHLVQRVRDEAHRFALSYQRRLREKLLFGK